MDGVLLVLDARTLPNLHALQTVETKTPPRRNRAVPAFATLILALVLGLVYYVSTQRTTNIEAPPPASAASTSNSLPEVNPTPEVIPTPEAQPSDAVSEGPKPEPPKAATTAAAVPVKRVAAKPTPPPPTKARVEEKKEDSKVGSILKKTGRILKKPFKF
jgi:hypothetical protein